MAYRTRNEISNHEELLEQIIEFKEIFCFIFRSASNPLIEITAYNPSERKCYMFKLSTRYQRNTTDIIREKYKTLISGTDFLKDFENISEVSLRAKGTVRGWHTVYSNPNTPIILPVYDAD